MARQKSYFKFHIVKWDETGNVLLENHTMVVQRQTEYPVAEGYFEELYNVTFKG